MRREGLAVDLGGQAISAVAARSISAVAAWLEALEFNANHAPVGEAIRAPLGRGLALLDELGLGYLQLSRRADSLSSGEFQRLRLALALSSCLTQML